MLRVIGQKTQCHAVQKPTPPSAPSIHNRSMDGINHNTRAMRPSAVCGCGLAVNAHLPRSAVFRPCFDFVNLMQGRATHPTASSPAPRDGGSCPRADDRRKPRPGDNSDTASRMLVLPAPFGPKIATGRASSVILASLWDRKCDRVKLRQRKRHHHPLLCFKKIPAAGGMKIVRRASA